MTSESYVSIPGGELGRLEEAGSRKPALGLVHRLLGGRGSHGCSPETGANSSSSSAFGVGVLGLTPWELRDLHGEGGPWCCLVIAHALPGGRLEVPHRMGLGGTPALEASTRPVLGVPPTREAPASAWVTLVLLW